MQMWVQVCGRQSWVLVDVPQNVPHDFWGKALTVPEAHRLGYSDWPTSPGDALLVVSPELFWEVHTLRPGLLHGPEYQTPVFIIAQ